MNIKYPTPKKVNTKKSSIKTLGMLFENELNLSNEYYRVHDVAIIYKKPTPIQVVKVDFPKRSASKIVEAYYKLPSTTDYNGVYKGKYIDYEAKETVQNTFSFSHIYKHQVDHLISVHKHGGIAFIIIYFRKENEIYIFDISVFSKLYYEGVKKSINYNDAKTYGIFVPISYTPPIDYLKAVDILLEKYYK